MKVAVIGSRNIVVDNIGLYLPGGVTEIISGGAKGVDTCAADYAKAQGIPLLLFLPQYKLYGRAAPFIRNRAIVDEADMVLAFWDGKSSGTKYTMDYARKLGKKVVLVTALDENLKISCNQ